jgi:predicted exporter
VWLAGAAIAAAILATRLQLSFDLSAFIPGQTTLAQEVMIEQARNGPASRLLVVGIGGSSPDQVVETGRQLRASLAGNPLFSSVLNGEFDEDSATIPAPIRDYFPIMRDIDYSESGIRKALQARMQDLAFAGGAGLIDLISRDPYLVTLEVLQSLAPAESGDGPWVASNGKAVLLAETTATSIDIAAQDLAIDAIRAEFSALDETNTLDLDITGVGAFSVELQKTIRAEATLRSLFASLALLLVLFVVFRDLRLLLLSAIPLVSGFVAGLTLVTLIFETVHGITLAFGFTLLGVAVDYPLHLFSHARSDSGLNAIRRIWPTMRLGAVSTVVAYLALTFSNSEGLAQLGLFTAGGVIVASLATRTWLPYLLPAKAAADSRAALTSIPPRLSIVFALACLAAGLVVVFMRGPGTLWNDDLSALSPVEPERLSADRVLRSAAVTANLRYRLAVSAESEQAVLDASETVDAVLDDAVAAGILEDWRSVTRLLPSTELQEIRKRNIPDPETLSRALDAAVTDTPFRADAFDEFVATAEAVRTSPPLTADDIRESGLRSWLDAHLIQLGKRHVALVSLVQPDAELLSDFLDRRGVPADLVDFQSASLDMMSDYRTAALRTIFVAAMIIVGLVAWSRGEFLPTLWVVLTVAAALTITVAIISMAHGSLTVIHLVALLLVLGLGLDYALFLSRSEPDADRSATDRGVVACAASTTIAFAILAASVIPVLKFLGLTVATGSLVSFALAYTGSRLRKPGSS